MDSATGNTVQTYASAAQAFFALCLLIVAGIQAWIYQKQRTVMEKQLKEAKTAADAAAKSANAADLSARAVIRIELPIIRAYGPELIDVNRPIPREGPIVGTVNDLTPGTFSNVNSIEFRNNGRTPALLSSIKIGWQITKNLPPVPTYSHSETLNKGQIIKADSEETIELPRHTITLTQDQIDAVIAKTVYCWFFVSLSYSDFMDDLHEARFCWRWGCPDGAGIHYFASDGNPPVDYTRKT